MDVITTGYMYRNTTQLIVFKDNNFNFEILYILAGARNFACAGLQYLYDLKPMCYSDV